VFGDRVQITPGMLAIEAGGIAALIVGVIAVARSSAFSGLRKITVVITPGSHAGDSRTPVNGSRRDDQAARKFSRPAHRRQVHESPSGGDGR
jgi:hypothetical protein